MTFSSGFGPKEQKKLKGASISLFVIIRDNKSSIFFIIKVTACIVLVVGDQCDGLFEQKRGKNKEGE